MTPRRVPARGSAQRFGRYAAFALALATAAAAFPAGSGCGSDTCPKSDHERCTGDTTYRFCAGGEGTFYWSDMSCPAEQHCEPITPYVDQPHCVGGREGAACVSDYGCYGTLRCIDGACRGATPEDAARCESGTLVVVPADGTEVSVELTLLERSISLKLTDSCGPGYPRPVGEAFVRMRPENDNQVVEIEAPTIDVQYSESPTCNDLYQSVTCGMATGARKTHVTILKCNQNTPVLYFTTADTRTLELKIHTQELRSATDTCSAKDAGGDE